MASMQEEAETSIIKSDRVGRAQYSQEYKAKVLAAFEQSGINAAAFASWVTKVRKKKDSPGEPGPSEQAKANPAFLIAEVPAHNESALLQVELAGGAVLKITDHSQLPLATALLKALL